MRAIYFDCFVGASGDVILGALADAGLQLEDLSEQLARLPVEGYRLEGRRVQKHGIGATKVDVVLTDSAGGHPHPTRFYREIVTMLQDSDLSPQVKEQSLAIFARLGEAEAKIHQKPLEKIHFHEVGAVDSIVDIVGAVIGLQLLGVQQVFCSSMPISHGVVKCAHGLLPVPAPATLEVLTGVPVREIDVDGETLTPTGAAILATISDRFGPMPEMTLEKVGYGAGTNNWPTLPNLLRVCIGELPPAAGPLRETIHLVEANIDDMNPELLGYAAERLFDAGAVDVYMTPIIMKKGRHATKLSALAPAERLDQVVQAFLRETTTFGVRTTRWQREVLARERVEVQTPWGKVRVKVGRIGDEFVTVAPEYEDCRRLAIENNVPLRRIYESVQETARRVLAERPEA